MAGHRHTRAIIVVVALVLLTVLTACSAHATGDALGGRGPSAASSLSPAAGASAATSPGAAASPSARLAGSTGGADAKAASTGGADWARVMKAVAWMRAVSPNRPVVVLLGGSAARESTISDASWRAQIERRGGPASLAWNMGSRNRTMAQNLAIVRALPKVPTVVLIGVNLGAFISAQKTASISLPSPAPTAEPSLQQPHQYSADRTLSASRKKALVAKWLRERYPIFTRNFSTSSGVLDTLIRVCQKRGYTPVLYELPRNTQIIGSSLRAPTARYRTKCRKLAERYDIPYINNVSKAAIPNAHFYDLWHLVEPGRKVWQKLLSAETAKILTRLDDGGS